jgi:hypothetical protein
MELLNNFTRALYSSAQAICNFQTLFSDVRYPSCEQSPLFFDDCARRILYSYVNSPVLITVPHCRNNFLLMQGLDDEIEILAIRGIAAQPDDICGEAKSHSDLDAFRKEVVNDEIPRQRFTVSREDGMEELKKDILSYYKDSKCKLTAKPRVRFEGEEGVGCGPIREFLLCAMKVVQDGIGGSGRHTMFFEGEVDHLIPIHDQSLRCTGSFKAIGRIIGHSLIHGGPLLYGLSPAVKRYWTLTGTACTEDPNLETLPASISIADVSDVDLRQYILQVCMT